MTGTAAKTLGTLPRPYTEGDNERECVLQQISALAPRTRSQLLGEIFNPRLIKKPRT